MEDLKNDLNLLWKDKNLNNKQITEVLSKLLIDNELTPVELIIFAETAKDPVRATCLEAFEYATQQKADLLDLPAWEFAVKSLSSKAPRVKWEAARVIANTAALFPDHLEEASILLLKNAEDKGTVVRWSAATALGAILHQKTVLNKELIPAIEALTEKEEKNSIRKIYLAALKRSIH